MQNLSKIKYSFAFFAQQFTQKQPKKCCRYNQNGIPFTPYQAQQAYDSVKSLITGWKLENNSLRLSRHFFTEDYCSAIEYVMEIAKIDSLSTKNCPGFHYLGGELLSLELYSSSLNGLSQIDFELAMRINELDISKYYLIPLEKKENYRQQVQAYRLREQSKKIQEELGKQ